MHEHLKKEHVPNEFILIKIHFCLSLNAKYMKLCTILSSSQIKQNIILLSKSLVTPLLADSNFYSTTEALCYLFLFRKAIWINFNQFTQVNYGSSLSSLDTLNIEFIIIYKSHKLSLRTYLKIKDFFAFKSRSSPKFY